MASVTRSPQDAEGIRYNPRAPHVTLSRSGSASAASTAPALYWQHVARHKRQLTNRSRGFESAAAKKSKLAVKLLGQTTPPAKRVIVRPASVLRKQPPLTAVPNLEGRRSSGTARVRQRVVEDDTTGSHSQQLNGIRREPVGSLAPSAEAKKEGRKLRSQEATRFKSDLSAYFPDYDEVIGNDPQEQSLLNMETPILLWDSNPGWSVPGTQGEGALLPSQPDASRPSVRGYSDSIFTGILDAQRIDFQFLETQHHNKNIEDPLPDSLFVPVHRRAERLERSIRNSEKGRAQHEKDQILRLLEGLQGHDWLKVMGVSRVTESKKKTYEPARAYFIRGCQAILDKFRTWNLEEKRRKQERDRVLADRATEEARADLPDEIVASNVARRWRKMREAAKGNASDVADDYATSQDDMSEPASPAKQPRQEALPRSRHRVKRLTKQRTHSRPVPPKAAEPFREFTSFFRKKHERDSAMNRHRRTGRSLAWGCPIPDFPEAEFDLPAQYHNDDTLKARERKKRKDKRSGLSH